LRLRALETPYGKSPSDLFREGDLGACLREASGSPSSADRIFGVRALIRMGRYNEALALGTSVTPSTPDEAAVLLALTSTSYSMQGDVGAARKALVNLRLGRYAIQTRFQLAYAWMLIAWVEGNADAMSAALEEVDVREAPSVYGQWLYARSWVASLRGEFGEQLSLLKQAVEHIAETPAAYDVSLLASATRALVHLVREISAKDAFEFAARIVDSIAWTDDLKLERFLTYRAMAWAYALRGAHKKAFRYAYLARDNAPSAMWIAASYADEAYLTRMAGENRSSEALLQHAIDRAKETNWTSRGEERIALLSLVELSADRDPASAEALMAIYDRISAPVEPSLALARDRRLPAMEDYARGTILAVVGRRAEAVKRLENAYSIFVDLGYAWRAAAAALRLHVLTGDWTWLRCAGEAVRDFPESSVAGEIRKRAGVTCDPRAAVLTPAQSRVYALLCEGLSDKRIAQILNISPETAKNHAARVRLAFGVHSRAELIATSRSASPAV
jgi:DNA-binding CsgD family transcriptional regulator/tetratricopeptide (TPR) repeat protein